MIFNAQLNSKRATSKLSSEQLPVWRFIPPIDAPGKVQMAIDRWLLEQHLIHHHPPTLRFYTWCPAAISLGYHQRRWPSFWQSLPLDLVRRPTGGRAVLHQGDLTYSIVTSGMKGNRQEVYKMLCQFLIEGWQQLGVELHYGKAGREYAGNPSCFATATAADLMLESGEKFIGSAQLYKGNAVLQHGSMILQQDRELFQQVFGYLPTLSIQLPLEAVGEELIEIVVTQLKQAASSCWGVELVEQPLLDGEWQNVSAFQFN